MIAPLEFTPVHVAHTGAITVEAPLAQAFQFFTPEGERAWVEGWEPEYLYRQGGECGTGTVFRTRHGNEETFWLVLDYDPVGGHAAYARLTPGSRLGTVTIAAAALDAATTRVMVGYELTSISAEGSALLTALTEEAYAEMLADWERRVGEVLARQPTG
jgi:hypothetical protein